MTITAKKFKEMLLKYGDYNVNVRANTAPNGKRYFSGFITKDDSTIVVYVNTESCYNPHCDNKALVRYARNAKDFTGGSNNSCMDVNLAFTVNQMFKSPVRYCEEFSR